MESEKTRRAYDALEGAYKDLGISQARRETYAKARQGYGHTQGSGGPVGSGIIDTRQLPGTSVHGFHAS